MELYGVLYTFTNIEPLCTLLRCINNSVNHHEQSINHTYSITIIVPFQSRTSRFPSTMTNITAFLFKCYVRATWNIEEDVPENGRRNKWKLRGNSDKWRDRHEALWDPTVCLRFLRFEAFNNANGTCYQPTFRREVTVKEHGSFTHGHYRNFKYRQRVSFPKHLRDGLKCTQARFKTKHFCETIQNVSVPVTTESEILSQILYLHDSPTPTDSSWVVAEQIVTLSLHYSNLHVPAMTFK